MQKDGKGAGDAGGAGEGGGKGGEDDDDDDIPELVAGQNFEGAKGGEVE